MKLSDTKAMLILAALIALLTTPGFSQEKTDIQTPEPAVVAPGASDATPQAKEIAIYGEVQSVDAAKGALSIQYYDYDSDSEKTSQIVVSAITKMENASNLGDIKKGDWVDVVYTVKDGSNIAKVVTVEKEDIPPEEPAKTANETVNLPEER